ncbi:MAG: AAA family ATPase [Dehalococcoidia bacterium]|nr:AAA family ATPase [Dehalococcoidia bacterium]
MENNGTEESQINPELQLLLQRLPPGIQAAFSTHSDLDSLLEIIIDLGRKPEARFAESNVTLCDSEVTQDDIDYVTSRISGFGDDNRAGIARTLHRISAIRNREGRIVGLTCRVGRAVHGTVKIIEDIIQSGKSVLLLGRPGIGKTTMLREAARVLSDDMDKRVVIVDTSNEIAGDGDIPHSSIGRARRMQVSATNKQHAVMIEAVENHMPQVIIIDEIGTELEAGAARTIAERGVQLIGTAHGNSLENLMINPTLSDLVGGIQAVTLGDEEAKRRGTQKTILERKSPPTFGVVVEIQDRYKVAVHPETAEAVDDSLRGQQPATELRWLEDGKVRVEKQEPARSSHGRGDAGERFADKRKDGPSMYLFGINRQRLEEEAAQMKLPICITDDLRTAGLMVTSKSYFRRKPQKIRDAESHGIPIYVLRTHTPMQLRHMLATMHPQANIPHPEFEPNEEHREQLAAALNEAANAAGEVLSNRENPVELNPQGAYIRRLQHLIAERNMLTSKSVGRDPHRRVMIYRDER